MDKPNKVVMDLLAARKKVKVSQKLGDSIESSSSSEDSIIKEYEQKSIAMTTDLIKFQAASKLASRDLSYDGLNIDQLIKISWWENDTEFLLKRFELEGLLTTKGIQFLGFNIKDGTPYPFIGKITELILDPITSRPINVTYIIGELSLTGTKYNLEESWTYNPEEKDFTVKRNVSRVESSRGRTHSIPEEYQREERFPYIHGEVFKNNITNKSDIENVQHLMKDKGSFTFYLLEKFRYLSPKIFNKAEVMVENEAVTKKKMKEDTFINITSRAGQFQQPVTVFNPTLPNSVIQQTIEFYDDQIFMYSLASRPTDSGKQAQTNNLEQSLKNELANNYIEFKKNLRESQFTKYMRLIAKELKITTEDETFRVNIELTMTQQRQLDPTIDGDAANGKIKDKEPE